MSRYYFVQKEINAPFKAATTTTKHPCVKENFHFRHMQGSPFRLAVPVVSFNPPTAQPSLQE